MKKNAALRILLPILFANVLVFLVSFFLLKTNNAPINSIDPLQASIQISMVMLLVLNVSILLSFMIYRKMTNKPKPLTIFLLTFGIFIAEVFLLFRNMTQYEQMLSSNVFGLSSFTTSLLLFVFFNLSAAYVITRYTKRKIDPK